MAAVQNTVTRPETTPDMMFSGCEREVSCDLQNLPLEPGGGCVLDADVNLTVLCTKDYKQRR